MTDEGIQRQRGRYNEYLRHYNPYKFKAARRKNRRKVNSKTNDPNSAISQGDFNKSDTEFDDSDVFMADYDHSSSVLQCDVNSSEAISTQSRTLSNDDQTQDTLNTTELEPEEMLDDSLGESSYEVFIGEDTNASLDSVSDSEDHDNLDMTSEKHESKPDDVLYSGAPLTSSTSFVLLQFVDVRYEAQANT